MFSFKSPKFTKNSTKITQKEKKEGENTQTKTKTKRVRKHSLNKGTEVMDHGGLG